MKITNIKNRKFGRLIAIRYVSERAKDRHVRWLCKCDCGNIKTIRGIDLRNGNTKSCGCLYKGAPTTHGMSRTKEYEVWMSMKQRCYNKKKKDYKYYGERGIEVCDNWLNDFGQFIKDMGSRPSRLTLERISNDGNYEPSNRRFIITVCKWATQAEQISNRRKWGKGV